MKNAMDMTDDEFAKAMRDHSWRPPSPPLVQPLPPESLLARREAVRAMSDIDFNAAVRRCAWRKGEI